MTILSAGPEANTASAPLGPKTRSATKPAFSPSYPIPKLAIPKEKPGAFANDEVGAKVPIVSIASLEPPLKLVLK